MYKAGEGIELQLLFAVSWGFWRGIKLSGGKAAGGIKATACVLYKSRSRRLMM